MTTLTSSPQKTSSAVIYARVSIDKKKRLTSVEQQEAESLAAAEAEGWRVARIFRDNDRSASRYASKVREQYALLLEHLGNAEVDVLILWESSRGGRELESWAGLLNLCRRQGVRIHVVSHRRTYNLDNPRDWRTLAEDGVDSAYESEKTRERILRGFRANAEKGRPHGKLLYGYRRIYDDRGTFVRQEPHPEQAPIVQEAARRVRAGDSLYSIAQDFQERGVPTPGGGQKWWPEQIPRLVTNPAYAGLRVHQGKVIGQAGWPALIDDEIFADCVARLADPKRKTHKDNALAHLLTGATFCAHCDGRMFVQKAPRATDSKHTDLTCRSGFCTAVKEAPVEQFVTKLVIKRLEQPDFLDLYAAPGSGSAAEAREQARKLRERLDGFYASAAEGGITPGALAAIEARLLPQIEEAESRSTAAPVPAVLREAAGPDAAQRWEAMPLERRRAVVRLLVEVRVTRAGRGRRYFVPEERLGASRWVGDSRTWGEIWASEGR